MSTTIKSITIEKVRGIDAKTFVFDLPPMIANKFHVLVAPNGFGKTSFAGAFASLKPRSLKVPDSLLHRNQEGQSSKLIIKYDDSGNEFTVTADGEKNEVASAFQVGVISSRLKPEAKSRSGYIQWAKPGASLVVEPVVLVEKIPEKPANPYRYASLKECFGVNGKVLPNLSGLIDETVLLQKFLSQPDNVLHQFTLKGFWKKMDGIIGEIHGQNGNGAAIVKWIESNKLVELRAIPELVTTADLLSDLSALGEVERLLAAYQMARIYSEDAKGLKKYNDRLIYQRHKHRFEELLNTVNSNPSWITVRPKETKGQLIVSFPSASDMSNGQRDLLSFVAQLLRAMYAFDGVRAILVIDEVFDYLDEANLLAAQFFATRLIDSFKSRGAEIFPLVLTHLDPFVFRHSQGLGRNDIKVHFLAKADDSSRNGGIAAMVKKRNHDDLKSLIGKHYFHYHPQSVDNKALFRAHSLKETWGISHDFYAYACSEFKKYVDGAPVVDLLAACVGARISIEKHAYDQLNADQRTAFTDEYNSSTRDKLNFAEDVGANVPTAHQMLGLLYNDALHFKDHYDYISPIVAKMNNGAVRGVMKHIPIAFA